MPGYRAAGWHAIRRMPATVLQTLQDDGTYPDLYYGTNLLDEVPQDLYKQDWWYRTTFTAPAGHTTYLLEFPGINYRAEIWLNGHLVADNTQIVGMHTAHELDVSRWVEPGSIERTGRQGHAGAGAAGHRRRRTGGQLVRLDQLELPRLPGAGQESRPTAIPLSPTAMRASGSRSISRSSGAVVLGPADGQHRTPVAANRFRAADDLHQPAQYSTQQVRGVLRATITRAGQARHRRRAAGHACRGEQREVSFTPDEFAQLTVAQPGPVVAVHPGPAQPL